MPKFRKKPIVVEAFRLTEETRESNVDWPEWMHAAWNKDSTEEGALYPTHAAGPEGRSLQVRTKEGPLHVPLGWWIIQGVEGELYPCENGIFEKTYEAVE